MQESARLNSLRQMALDRVKDTAVFSRITQLTAETFGCPVAIISIIEEQRQWFLASTGFDSKGTPRNVSFCTHCIEAGAPLIIEDTAQDSRFADSPLVTETPKVRSYLGIPLAAEDGALIGTLWVASTKPSAFTADDIPRLSAFAQLTEQCFAAHKKTLDLAQANASLCELNQLFKQAETTAHIGSWRVDLRNGALQWSDQVFAIHGVPVGTQIEVDKAIEFYIPEDRSHVEKMLARSTETGEAFSFEATIQRQDGQLRRIRTMGERIDSDGEPESITGVFVDCTEEHLQTAALQRAATRDALTSLYNRSEFDRRLGEALQRNRKCGQKTTLMLLDLDGFKAVNDGLGHLIGDQLLVKIANALEAHIDDASFLARWGGDEFAILFPPDRPLVEAAEFAEALVQEISELLNLDGRPIQIGATCGIAQVSGAASSEEIVRRADIALYHGKQTARGSVQLWSENIEDVQSSRQSAILTLTQAFKSDRAFAAYQPIFALDSGTPVAVEALLRLHDENGQVISAGQVFPALLDTAIARRVSRFMLDQIKSQSNALLALYGKDCQIGINVSKADLSQPDFLDVIEGFLTDSVLTPKNIVLEVTETMLLLDEAGHVRELLNLLDSRGFTIALDDFGTGFSSLTHLRDFPIRKVKIDKGFIAKIGHDHQSRLIIQAMVQMGQSLGIRMVAEGVETEEQINFLRSIGCTHVQGFMFARPQSLEQLQAQANDPSVSRDAA